jgi:hypothetical protein
MTAKCPKCSGVAAFSKEWKYHTFNVRVFKCTCGNTFREYSSKGELKFVLSEHDQSLPRGRSGQMGFKAKRQLTS